MCEQGLWLGRHGHGGSDIDMGKQVSGARRQKLPMATLQGLSQVTIDKGHQVEVMAVVIDKVRPLVDQKIARNRRNHHRYGVEACGDRRHGKDHGWSQKFSLNEGNLYGWLAFLASKNARKTAATMEIGKENGPIGNYCSSIGARGGPGLIVHCEAIIVVPVQWPEDGPSL